jgi:release factor glutamine methyltransferase
MSNIQSQISNIQSALQAAYPADEANALAWWIAEELTGLSRTELQFGCKGTNFSSHMQEIETIIDRLLHFEPIQYIFGHTLWNGLDLKVTPSTLIPRPETAELVERINLKSEILNLKSQIHVLDVGTGSGCIAISLKKAHPEWSVTGIDISPEAVEVARENARRNNVDVHFEVADIFSDQMTKYLNKWYMVNDQMVNIVVSNPPYICESEKVSMKSNVLDYEPSTALFVPDSDPLLFYRRIAELQTRRSPNSKQGGAQTPKPLFLFFEINEAYGPQLSAMLENIGYTDIQIHKDIYGKDRIIEARMAR